MLQNNENTNNDVKLAQKYLLVLLKYLHNLCTSHNIKYSLESGTLLGAVREKGFIPWDDDADISLVRSEYDRLINILKTEKLPDDIGIYFPEDESEFFDFSARLYYKGEKVRGGGDIDSHYNAVYTYANCDLFVMDNIPSDTFGQKLYILLQRIVYGLAMSKRHKITIKKFKTLEKIAISILSTIGKLFSLKTICKIHHFFSTLYKNKNTGLLYCSSWSPEYAHLIYKNSSYEKVHLTEFEDTKFYIIDDYDEPLTLCYGNWREPVKTPGHDTTISNM